MNEEILKLLQEEIGDGFVDVRSIFEGYVPDAAKREAADAWAEKVKTREGQLELLDAAQHSEPTAVNYLYNSYIPLIINAFWKYYIGPNKKLGSKKIINGGAFDFAGVAYELLAGIASPSPYRVFDPTKLPKGSLINAFSYYFYRYLQNEAFKMNRSDSSGKISRADDNEEVEFDQPVDDSQVVQSLDSFDKTQDIPVEDFSNKSDITLIFDDFSKWLGENKPEEYKTIWDELRKGTSYQDIAEDFGWDAQKIRNYFKRIRKYFLTLYPDLKSQVG